MSSPKSSRSRLWFLWHSWLAMPVWLFMLFVCVTGCLAVISPELTWLFNPALRVSEDGPAAPLSALAAAAQASLPTGRVSALVWLDAATPLAVAVKVALPSGFEQTAWVNPVTAQVQAVTSGMSLRSFFRSLHGWLLVYPGGWFVVSATGLPLLGSLITGVVVYKKFWRAYLHPRLRRDKGPRSFWGDLHRLLAIWSLWFVGLMAITGTWFLIYLALLESGVSLGTDEAHHLTPRQDLPLVMVGQQPPAPTLVLDQALAAMQQARPGFRPLYIALPASAYDSLTLYGVGSAPLLMDEAHAHPLTGALTEVSPGSEASGWVMTQQIMRSLHVGAFGGWPLRLLWLLCGLMLCALAISGMTIWRHRTRPATPSPVLKRRWQRGWIYLSALVLLIPLSTLPFYLTGKSLFPTPEHQQTVQIGAYTLTLSTPQDRTPRREPGVGLVHDYRLHVTGTDYPPFRGMFLRYGKPDGLEPEQLGELAHGSPFSLHAHVPLPATAEPLWLSVEGWDGVIHQVMVPLPWDGGAGQ
ncbi:PepSY-associated TM helix domain-containing protein [Insolitispirillum peregrinum]|uniref:Uncharacterized iron-regulated membrane protein n=1 Tax=Insolitispirillum peregrinum TaxID=80876 RepID=A0A1N7KDU0_9PROT|nr:PepSY-associated TM helix domain-containing protein [Insolitispirillum peregrinum]SIS59765.1 Uncharacterized iron-regulated membrane protein [Insolitispirillum peregrinum]